MGEKGGSVHGLNPVQVEKLILIRYGGRLKVVIKVSDGLIYCTPLRECKLQTKPLDKF
ncbi:hypothetical protein NEIFLAOT_00961 [Neisseria flavescens NRL30031/H210]|uniref:Uncharacterized protein n=1 Tax=Neisseria flavescens NRL30031/H210 TaxID=546264 RepID=C0ELZ7_NEIFL|nr:hypothetical protein NEIFLAOT_00961 [Neisseria flavescens NRL30031/H210]